MKAVKVTVFLAVVSLGGICGGGGLVGINAPEITIQEWITKNPPSLEALAGRVYVLEFWATWCHSCVQTVPHLIALSNKYREKGLELIALSQDKSAEKVRRFVLKRGINYDVAIDDGTSDWFGIKAYPTVVVVNHMGKVVWCGYPWSRGFEESIEAAILAGPPPLLVGIDLGPFSHLREPLWGGKNFATAYRKIASQLSNRRKPEISAAAKQIVGTINRRISRKISKANRLRATDPLGAYSIYTDIVARYDGIEIVKPARKACLELKKKYGQINKQIPVSKKAAKAI